MTVVNAWAGGVTPTSARVVAKISGTNAELFVADNPAMTGAVSFGAVAADADDIADLEATGLERDTEYWWQIEVDTVADTATTGQFRTHPPPGEQHSFIFWAAGDAGLSPDTPGVGAVLAASRLSNHAVFETIHDRALAENWLFGVHLGDLHYYDLGSDDHGITGGASEDNYRRAIDDLLLQPRQHELYRDVPLVLLADDHDRGTNDHDRTFDGTNFETVYRQRVPHYPLADPDGIWHTWQVGRVRFLVSDVRHARDPNDTPQGPAKTMLGTAQKDWMRDILENDSSAELLVWLCPERAWHVPAVASGSSADHWGNFPQERNELALLFEQTGWADRMVYIGADAHQMGIDSGDNNQFGGFPVAQFAALDASPAGLTPAGIWDVASPTTGRGQYGTVAINDLGHRINVTLTGWADTTEIMSHTFSVVLVEPDPPDGDGDGLAQVSQARITTRLTWLSCNLSDGAVITELPDLVGDEVSRVIGEYTSANLGLPIPAVGGRDLTLSQRAHLAAISTEPARTMIVPVVNDVPTAGFIPLTRDLGTEATVALGCVSLEGYLRHRYVGDHLWEGVDPAEIARGVLADAEDIDGNGQGLNLIVDAPDIGANAGRYFEAIDDETVYGALSELMDAGLIEWTIDVDWRDGMAYRIVDKIARVRLRLGRSGDPTAVFQSATFSSQGASDARYTLTAEHSGDRYGNWIVARGTGEGEDKPRSSAQIDQGALDGGAPIWEQRIQPDIYRSPLFTESQFNAYVQEQLLLHAQQELARIRRGGQTLEITARWDAPGARYGVDWSIGDDVLHELKGHAHPDGLHGVRRAIGFALSIQRGTIRPILQEEDA